MRRQQSQAAEEWNRWVSAAKDDAGNEVTEGDIGSTWDRHPFAVIAEVVDHEIGSTEVGKCWTGHATDGCNQWCRGSSGNY